MSLKTSNKYYSSFSWRRHPRLRRLVEVLSHVSHNRNPESPDRMFKIKTVACSRTICAANSLTVHANLLFPDAVDRISDFHILVIPGGPPSVLQPLVENSTPELDFIRKFATLPADVSSGTRILLSICTGVFLLGAAGILGGMTVTTHHHALARIQDIGAHFNAPDDHNMILHKRYIGGGLLKGDGVRLLTAGGVSSGLDATCYLISQLAAHDMVAFVTRDIKYDWCELKE